MPDNLRPQIPYIKEIVAALRIPILEKESYEADDLIGSMTKKLENEGIDTVIVSGDKDLMQLIDHQVTMYDPMKDKTFKIPEVKERFGVTPDKVVEVMGLSGDTSDNIPGVPGIGEKTASRLIEEFGSIEELLKNLDKVKNAKVRGESGPLWRAGPPQPGAGHAGYPSSRGMGPEEIESGKVRTGRNCKKSSKRWNFPSSSRNLLFRRPTQKKTISWSRKKGFSKTHPSPERGGNLRPGPGIHVHRTHAGRDRWLSFSFQPHQAFYFPVGHIYPGAPPQLDREEVLESAPAHCWKTRR